MFKNTKKKYGFTLIEAMVVLFVFSLITICFYSAFSLGMQHIRESKFRLEVTAVANEKMEIVRNLDYDNIGTTTGIPQGDILEKEIVNENTGTYYVFTSIRYIDDSYDGTEGGSPSDAVPTDYKKVRITVAWEDDQTTSRAVTLFSNFVPNGLETNAGGGTLSINVLNNSGIGIPQALVHIFNESASVDDTVLTDDSGNISLPAMPSGNQNYSLSVSKSGYYSVQTYPPYPTSSFTPVDVHASVVEDSLNVKSIITDETSKINLYTKDYFGNSVSDINFNITGGKKKGDTPEVPSEPVYEYDADLNSGSSGLKELSDMSFGIYFFTLNSSDYEFIKMDPGQDIKEKLDLPPGTEVDINAVLADKDINSLLVKVYNKATGDLIEGASVELKNDLISYDVTLITDIYGQVYFPQSLPELTVGEYQLSVSANGFQNDDSIVILEDLIIKEVKLNSI